MGTSGTGKEDWLVSCAAAGDVGVVRALLHAGASQQAVDGKGLTPLARLKNIMPRQVRVRG